MKEHVDPVPQGVALSNDNVRWIAIVFWLAISGLVALAARRLTRRDSIAAITFAATFMYLRAITSEPGHPQEMCGLLLALIAAMTTWADPEGPGGSPRSSERRPLAWR